MIEKKATIVATLIALTLLGAPLAASAAPVQTVKTIGTTFHSEDGDEHDDEDEDEDEDDEDDEHSGYIPPVYVVPGHKKHHKEHTETSDAPGIDDSASAAIDPITGLPFQTSGIDPVTGEEFIVVGAGGDAAFNSLGGVNPEEARAVDIRRVTPGMRTPADQFMDAAYIGMGMLGVAALGLGGTAAVRAVRLRRSGKSDYFYGDK